MQTHLNKSLDAHQKLCDFASNHVTESAQMIGNFYRLAFRD